MSNAALNRKIKADRIYKTLGKMSWQRIVLGVTLLILVFFLAGIVSEYFFSKGHYELAERCMISEKWMANNKPDTKAIIDAGALYAKGDYDAAYNLIAGLNPDDLYTLNLKNYALFCTELGNHYALSADSADAERAELLLSLADKATSLYEGSDATEEANN